MPLVAGGACPGACCPAPFSPSSTLVWYCSRSRRRESSIALVDPNCSVTARTACMLDVCSKNKERPHQVNQYARTQQDMPWSHHYPYPLVSDRVRGEELGDDKAHLGMLPEPGCDCGVELCEHLMHCTLKSREQS
jgi:hypothetical protein